MFSDTFGEDSERDDEESKGEKSGEDGATAVCPFSLFLLYREVFECENVL